MNFWQQLTQKSHPDTFKAKDAKLDKVLGTKDFLALGVGTIVGTAIFTLPGTVAASHAGPAVVLSFLAAAVVAGLVAFAYAEMASAMPFAGSAYSWISVLFGNFFGWIAGWALLAEYFIAVAFVSSGISANWRGLFAPLGLKVPTALATPLLGGGFGDFVAVLAIVFVAVLLARGTKNASRFEMVMVLAKVFAIFLFLVVGVTAFHIENLHPFIPAHQTGTSFGGVSGIWAGVAGIFLAYIGFDSIAANSAEAKNPAQTMPRGILGSLLIAVALFAAVSLVLVGMFKYTKYANNAEPVAWALREAGHPIVATTVAAIAVLGMFTALVGMMLAGSRLLYAFGRDGMLPNWLGRVNDKDLPNNGLLVLTVIAIVIGAFFPFAALAELISAGTLIAFTFVSFGIYALRRRAKTDLPNAGFKMPLYPVLPALAGIGSISVFLGLGTTAKVGSLIWFVLGVIVYFAYGFQKKES
ncbi:MAG TPA: amino acid permease [Lactobacillaceae bacterium]|jgi:APA family basic amino acid/polyamine antiporter